MLCAMVECVSVGRSGAVLSREVLSIGQTVIECSAGHLDRVVIQKLSVSSS